MVILTCNRGVRAYLHIRPVYSIREKCNDVFSRKLLYSRLLKLFLFVYCLYSLYNANMYSVSSFRTNIRQAFEDAAAGQEVIIERYGRTFRLVPGDLVDKETLQTVQRVVDESVRVRPEHPKEVDTTIIPPITPVMQPISEARMNQKYCPLGHPYPLGRERCMGKGCKYS